MVGEADVLYPLDPIDIDHELQRVLVVESYYFGSRLRSVFGTLETVVESQVARLTLDPGRVEDSAMFIKTVSFVTINLQGSV